MKEQPNREKDLPRFGVRRGSLLIGMHRGYAGTRGPTVRFGQAVVQASTFWGGGKSQLTWKGKGTSKSWPVMLRTQCNHRTLGCQSYTTQTQGCVPAVHWATLWTSRQQISVFIQQHIKQTNLCTKQKKRLEMSYYMSFQEMWGGKKPPTQPLFLTSWQRHHCYL